MAPGRKRKPGKRYPCGKRTKQQLEMDAMSVAIDARRRQFGVSAKQAKDERLGTALGRLAFRELISETQYQAGVAFAELYRQHHAVFGLPSPSPRSVTNSPIHITSPAPAVITRTMTIRVKMLWLVRMSRLQPCSRPPLAASATMLVACSKASAIER